MKRITGRGARAFPLALILWGAAGLAAAGWAGTAAGAQSTDAPVHVLHVRGPIYMLVGAGGNITVSVSPEDGVLMVDTGTAAMSDAVLATIENLKTELGVTKPIRYIINTHLHADHTGGNERMREAGFTYTGGNVAGDIQDAGAEAAVYAHENVLRRMVSEGEAAFSFGVVPSEVYLFDRMRVSHFFNGEGVEIFHMPEAHTDGDSFVVFRDSDVIAAGDIFSTELYPIIDLDRGGSLQGVIDALNNLLDMAFPDFRYEGGTLIVPGHGRLSDAADVAYYRDMLTIIRDRLQAMISEGMTLDEIQAARPTLDYDPRYSRPGAFWTTEQFVEAAYRSLTAQE